MRKSGLTSATLQELRRKAQQTAGFEVEIEMEVNGEPQEFEDLDERPSGDDIAPDLPGEPWNSDWEVTAPILEEPEDNTSRNLEGRKLAYDIRNYYEEHVPALERPRGPVGIYVDIDLWDLPWIDYEADVPQEDIDHYLSMIERDLTEALNLGEEHHLVVQTDTLSGTNAVEVRVEGVYPDMADELKRLVQKLTYQSAIDVAKSYGGQGVDIFKGGHEPEGGPQAWERMTEPGAEEERYMKEMAPGFIDPDDEYEEYWQDPEERWDDYSKTGERDAAMVRRVIKE